MYLACVATRTGRPRLESKALRLFIRQKLADGRLPRSGVHRMWGGAGNGEPCHACDEFIKISDFVMEGPVHSRGRSARRLRFHAICFYLWEDERLGAQDSQTPSTHPDRMSDATAYREHLILTVATEQPSGGWGVAVSVYDPDGALAMESPDLGDSVTFETKATADNAGALFARAWIDRRG